MSEPRSGQLPKFDAPPVVETVLGIEFVPLAQWDVPHFGLFWNEIRSEFPNFESKPPLGSAIESPEAMPVRLQLELQEKLDPRCWFLTDDKQRLIQVQNNRFLYNWRKGDSATPYPEYDASVRPAFARESKRFSDFLSTVGLGPIEVLQGEVTYVNHLEIGKGWLSAADLTNVLRCWAEPKGGTFLPSPEGVSLDVRYRFPKNLGRLHVSLRPAVRNTDGAEILQLKLTARGRPEGSDLDSALIWLDTGREWVVRGFADLTTDAMHKIWRRRA